MRDEIFGKGFVNLDALALRIWAVCADFGERINPDDAFIGREIEVIQVLDDLLDAPILFTLLIRVLDAQEVDSLTLTHHQLIDQRRQEAANVDKSRRARGKARYPRTCREVTRRVLLIEIVRRFVDVREKKLRQFQMEIGHAFANLYDLRRTDAPRRKMIG